MIYKLNNIRQHSKVYIDHCHSKKGIAIFYQGSKESYRWQRRCLQAWLGCLVRTASICTRRPPPGRPGRVPPCWAGIAAQARESSPCRGPVDSSLALTASEGQQWMWWYRSPGHSDEAPPQVLLASPLLPHCPCPLHPAHNPVNTLHVLGKTTQVFHLSCYISKKPFFVLFKFVFVFLNHLQ